MFRLVSDLSGTTTQQILPDRPCKQDIVDDLGDFFVSKISTICSNPERADQSTNSLHTDEHKYSPLHRYKITDMLLLRPVSKGKVKLVLTLQAKSYSFDPLPTNLLKACLSVIVAAITDVVNLSFNTDVFPRIKITLWSHHSLRNLHLIEMYWGTTGQSLTYLSS